MIKLYEHQINALKNMHNGCILNGGVGSGKSLTSLAYFVENICGGKINEEYKPMRKKLDLYIITTARKRDTLEWEGECCKVLISTNSKLNSNGMKLTIDSWNNIKKYADVKNSFFIFDEQRVVGYGAWARTFIKISKNNQWILLSATPGDTWSDYIPVFIANGFYKNKKDFEDQHVIYSRFTKYPKIDRYINMQRLMRLRDRILIDMKDNRTSISHHIDIFTEYNKEAYKVILKNRWNIFENKPVKNANELCMCYRKLVNTDKSRIEAVKNIVADNPRVIIFYNFNYELDILKNIDYRYKGESIRVLEWNGMKHQEIPNTKKWIYLVQYNAGCEGWNCIKTNTIIFYSENYSFRIMEQASGRIDRLNTPYHDLYYYHLRSKSPIDLAIHSAYLKKKKFNERKFVGDIFDK